MTPLWPIGWRHLNWSQISVRRLRKMVGFDSKTNPADPLAIPFGIEKWPRMRCVHWIAPARPIEEGGGGRDKGVSCCPRTLWCARVWGACGTINLSSDDALDVLQISCRSRARSREGFSRGWAEAHPHPGPLSGGHTSIGANSRSESCEKSWGFDSKTNPADPLTIPLESKHGRGGDVSIR